MEVIGENVFFSSTGRSGGHRKCRTMVVNFRKLRSSAVAEESKCEHGWCELLHAVAGLYSVSLPDMELSAIYSSLTSPGTKTVLALASKDDILQQRSERSDVSREGGVPSEADTGGRVPSEADTGGRVPSEVHTGGGVPSEVDTGGRVRKDTAIGETDIRDRVRPVVSDTPCRAHSEDNGRHSSSEDCVDGEEEDGGNPFADGEEEDGGNPFADLFSGPESSESESDEGEDEFGEGRDTFLARAQHRKSLSQLSTQSVGPEHCVLGCATFLRLTSKPGSSAVQVTLLAVRKSCRKCGIGRYLMQCCKDPAVVGHYDVLVVFSDHKAEGFFSHHGLTDDPIITARYRDLVDDWVNSTLMAYLAPFSGPSVLLGVSSLKALSQFEDQFKSWRDHAIESYSEQLGFLERVRHEVMVLHSKLQSQEEVIGELSRQLKVVCEERSLLQREFMQYRETVQRLLCDTVMGRAEGWLRQMESGATPLTDSV